MSTVNQVFRELADQAGSRPFFLYDLDAFGRHVQAMPDGPVQLWYACKANPLSSLLRILAEAGWGFDVASEGELNQVLGIGVDPERILVTGPAKSESFLRTCLRAGVRKFVLESHNQLLWLSKVSAELKTHVEALLRIQLRWREDGRNPLGGNAESPFGLSPSEWAADWNHPSRWVSVIGVHAFQWGQILCPDRLFTIWERVAQEALALFAELGFELQVLDLGGGLGIPYGPEESDLAWQEVSHRLERLGEDYRLPKLWLEPGRYAAGPFGQYAAPVIDRKRGGDGDWLVLAGGMHHLLRPALTGTPFPCFNADRRDGSFARFQLAGPLCTALDRFGQYNLPEETSPGDWLVFGQVGAYGFTESMPYFLCHDLPGEAVVKDGAATWIRRSEPAQVWLR